MEANYDLPDDFFVAVAMHLSVKDMMSLAMTCKHLWSCLAENNVLWKHYYIRDFPDPQAIKLDKFKHLSN